jgi:hypothetical protein
LKCFFMLLKTDIDFSFSFRPAGCQPSSRRCRKRSMTLSHIPVNTGLAHLTMLMYLYDESAVSTQLILTSQVLPADGPFAGDLNIHVPLLQSISGAPDVSVAEIQLGLGPEKLTYSEVLAGKLIHYMPQGIKLPKRCPRGGFPFAVTLGFEGGGQASARTAVACPGGAGRRRGPVAAAPTGEV